MHEQNQIQNQFVYPTHLLQLIIIFLFQVIFVFQLFQIHQHRLSYPKQWKNKNYLT